MILKRACPHWQSLQAGSVWLGFAQRPRINANTSPQALCRVLHATCESSPRAWLVQLPQHAVFWSKVDGGHWFCLKDVLLPDKACTASPDLSNCVEKIGLRLTSMPHNVMEIVRQNCPGSTCITPGLMRERLRSDKQLKGLLSSLPNMQATQVSLAILLVLPVKSHVRILLLLWTLFTAPLQVNSRSRSSR